MYNFEEKFDNLQEKETEFRNEFTDKEYIERLENALLICENIAMNLEQLPDNLKTDMEKSLHGGLNVVYRISHVARLPGCFDKHKEWEKEFKDHITILLDD